MVFSSLIFLCVFLPVTFGLYYLIPSITAKNILLIIVSFLFYAYGEPVYVILMFISCVFNYAVGRAIMWRRRRLFVAIAVIVNLVFLGVFKYTGFVMETINGLFGLNLDVVEIALPVGISFYTFQALSYVIDVYRDPKIGQRNLLNVLLYISFFPQLIAGPIVRFDDIVHQIRHRVHSVDKISGGICRFVRGLGKKVLLANTMAVIADNIFNAPGGQVNVIAAWIGALAYAFQIYYDFCGYSDMALGMAQMFGFRFLENFNAPYVADGIQDFWHRWHISLSTWFKEYLYIPLGGNRKGKARTILNRYIVFFCTGLWHGANWTFILWGLLHGTCLVLENTRISLKRIPVKGVRQIITFILVVCAFVIFRADDIGHAFAYLGTMFTGGTFSSASMDLMWAQLTPVHIFMLILSFLCIRPWNISWPKALRPVVTKGVYVWTLILLLLCMINLASNAYNPFIYFRF
ncbi:alginate O-acetyltransferase complex protein AlgI [Catenibacillus scindens]|uniref:Alginate O-acetyltransferase complex protein AlgI n=1 Tax=Catenibacillus scindens TaxID=673271 RepID=A0A7W8M5W1_9FIRM|nr:MBOAT family protein [Catenibacillus scindens]MBB5264791.1 alginate O-acetyltransferase complex protein AlgI [Catenibacillus scindens]